MDLEVFLAPSKFDYLSTRSGKARFALPDQRVYASKGEFPETKNLQVALIGVKESRRGEGDCNDAPDLVRKHLYTLYDFDADVRFADLGDIEQGNSYDDTAFAVTQVCETLIKHNILPVIIGGSQDLTYAMYKAYEKQEQTVNMVTVDSRLDFGDQTEEARADSYLNQIVLHKPNFLFNYSNLGHQRYMVDPEMIELMDNMYFDLMRLGEIQENVRSTEPYLRNADIASFDIGAIRNSDAPGAVNSGPNGLYGDQACQICRYIGISDKMSTVGFFNYDPSKDRDEITSMLISQMIWCLIDGYKDRKGDYPIGDKKDYARYTVHLASQGHDLVFYKSSRSDRWWLEVPFPAGKKNRYERHHLVPCSYEDYQLATNEEVPDRWWKTYQKLT